ncbi:MAG: formylglycine-generating enzyme family protein [Elusimicrobiota bacterium]
MDHRTAVIVALWPLLAACAAPRKEARAEKPHARAAPDVGIQWTRIPGGIYTRGIVPEDGSDWALHRVTVRSFELSRSLVTNKQYKSCVADGACTPAHAADGECLVHVASREAGDSFSRVLPESFQGDDQPAVCVDWNQARIFSLWAGGRLPSESEWEYAAKSGGTKRRFPWGDEDASCERAVVSTREDGYGCGKNSTWPVCSKPAGDTKQGLCDMAGNAWEWMEDSWLDSYDAAPTDGRPWEDSGPQRVVRGGSWFSDGVSVGNRLYYRKGESGNHVGFRVAR